MKTFEFTIEKAIPFVPEKSLFLDIETTGLSVDKSHMYLFGCLWQEGADAAGDMAEETTGDMAEETADATGYESGADADCENDRSKTEDLAAESCKSQVNTWHFRQWLMESPFEERTALTQINEFIKSFNTIITFNGDNFDLPYLEAHLQALGLESNFSCAESFDLYKRLRILKNLFSLDSCSQKSFETFMDTGRTDEYDGGRLIKVYYDYCKTGDEGLLELLLLHNREDVLGLSSLMTLLPYAGLYDKARPVTEDVPRLISSNDQELFLEFNTCETYPYWISTRLGNLRLSIDKSRLRLRLPVINRELKFFFSPAKDYYYLTTEDMAIHKSVATYVDPAFRIQATNKTCYIKKTGSFIPAFKDAYKELFYENYGTLPYVQVSDKLMANTAFWNKYLHHVLSEIKSQGKA